MSEHLKSPDRATTETAHHGARRVDIGPEQRSSMRWLWLLLIPLLLLLAWLFWPRHHEEQVADTAPAATQPSAPTDSSKPADVAAATPSTPTPAAAVPPGSGVVSETRDGKPALIVYFETGKSEVTQDLGGAVGNIKSFIDGHSGANVSVSGYNDPTGDAATNAALSKQRAEAVQKALTDAGIPADHIQMAKPEDTTGSGDTNAQARRVEVIVHE